MTIQTLIDNVLYDLRSDDEKSITRTRVLSIVNDAQRLVAGATKLIAASSITSTSGTTSYSLTGKNVGRIITDEVYYVSKNKRLKWKNYVDSLLQTTSGFTYWSRLNDTLYIFTPDATGETINFLHEVTPEDQTEANTLTIPSVLYRTLRLLVISEILEIRPEIEEKIVKTSDQFFSAYLTALSSGKDEIQKRNQHIVNQMEVDPFFQWEY